MPLGLALAAGCASSRLAVPTERSETRVQPVSELPFRDEFPQCPDADDSVAVTSGKQPSGVAPVLAEAPSPPARPPAAAARDVPQEGMPERSVDAVSAQPRKSPERADAHAAARVPAAPDGGPRPRESTHAGTPPARGAAAETDPAIRPFDVLTLDVFGEADLSGSFVVSSGGWVKHPLLDRVELAGLTVADAERKVTALLAKDYLVKPRVSIRISKSSGRQVAIFGEVKQPGTYVIPPDESLSLLRLIGQAGGFTDIAATSRVRIVRLLDGKEQILKIDVDALLKGKADSTDVPLEPGDIVTVPETIF